jgi:hypothetical protein
MWEWREKSGFTTPKAVPSRVLGVAGASPASFGLFAAEWPTFFWEIVW